MSSASLGTKAGAAAVPEDDLLDRHRSPALERQFVESATLGFIESARHAGWGWQMIGTALGLSDVRSSEQWVDQVKAERNRRHPSINPQPWMHTSRPGAAAQA